MKTLLLKIEYDGTNYSGWQRQLNSNSVQEEIESALSKILQKNLQITGAGRTDAGVHANGQVATLSLDFDINIPDFKITKALNSNLPKDIRISGSAIMDGEINARFDAIAREYIYNISTKDLAIKRNYISFIKYPISSDLLFKASKLFIGENDFTTFSKLNEDTKNYRCKVEISEWTQVDDIIFQYRIKANRFVYGMVRSIVGTMIDIARGKVEFEKINKFLNAKDRSLNSPLAAAKGLILEKIDFPFEIEFK
jgi:tRNA pseudouridine38-40 synthase